jgi:hypothetical protein
MSTDDLPRAQPVVPAVLRPNTPSGRGRFAWMGTDLKIDLSTVNGRTFINIKTHSQTLKVAVEVDGWIRMDGPYRKDEA